MSLSQEQKDFMKLILRSPDIGDGWRRVSHMLTPVVSHHIALSPELFESESRESTLYIRLTEKGKTVGEYI